MTEEKTSILLADVSIEGDLLEKDKIILDAKIKGDIKANEILTHSKSNILGNIRSIAATGPLCGSIKAIYISVRKRPSIAKNYALARWCRKANWRKSS